MYEDLERSIPDYLPLFNNIEVDKNKYSVECKNDELRNLLDEIENYDSDEIKDTLFGILNDIIYEIDNTISYNSIYYYIRDCEYAIDRLKNTIDLIEDEYGDYEKEEYTCYMCWETFDSAMYSDKCPSCLQNVISDIEDFISELNDFSDYFEEIKSRTEELKNMFGIIF